MNPALLKQFFSLENNWIHTFSIPDFDLQLSLQNIHLSKFLFLNKEPPQYKHIEETINPINLRVPIKESFYASLNNVKETPYRLKTQNTAQMHLMNLNNIYIISK